MAIPGQPGKPGLGGMIGAMAGGRMNPGMAGGMHGGMPGQGMPGQGMHGGMGGAGGLSALAGLAMLMGQNRQPMMGLHPTQVMRPMPYQPVSMMPAPGMQPLGQVCMGLGWESAPGWSGPVDLDASAIIMGPGMQPECVYFGQLFGAGGAVTHSGDNRTGQGWGDDEVIMVDLNRLPMHINAVEFTVTSKGGGADQIVGSNRSGHVGISLSSCSPRSFDGSQRALAGNRTRPMRTTAGRPCLRVVPFALVGERPSPILDGYEVAFLPVNFRQEVGIESACFEPFHLSGTRTIEVVARGLA